MTRTLSGPEATLLAGPVYRVTPRVKVANGSGTMVDLTSWMESITIELDIDQPVSGVTVEFRRDSNTLSLAPLRADSILNRDDLGNYSPQLDPGRALTIEVATTALASAPAGGDYKLLFVGTLDFVGWENSPMVTTARDQGGQLVDRWVETEKTYGSVSGTPIQTVMQQILNDVFGTVNPVTLYVPVDPGFNILRYRQQKQSVMDALFALAQTIGWDVRYKFDSGTGTFRLTLSQPPRTKTVPDYTFGPSQYLDITTLNIDRTNIRNVISVSFYNAVTRARIAVVANDPTSITRYGRRYFEIQEADDSPIDTGSEASTLASSVLSDLKDPKAEHELETHFLWPVELNDLYRQSPNAVHYNSNQDFASVNITHRLSRTKHRTTIKTRGNPAGAYETWNSRRAGGGRFPGIPQPDTGLALNDFKVIAETDTTITYGWTAGGLVAEVWAADILFTEPLPADPWTQVLFAMAPLPAGTISYTLTKPIEGQIRFAQVEPRDANLTPGTVRRVALNHAPTQPPTIELDDIETGTVGTQWWSITERGLHVTAVQVQTQVGSQPISDFGTPTRGPGDTSLVRGGTLGTGQYEHDISLDPTRISWIVPRLTLENGAQIVLGPFGFDRDKNPNILQVTLSETVLTILADSDTKSLKVYDTTGLWVYQVDGLSAVVDVSLTDAGAHAGLGASESKIYGVVAYNEPLAYVDGSTLFDEASVPVSGGSAPAASALWDTVSLQAPFIDENIAALFMKATAAPAGWDIKVYIDIGLSTVVPTTDHTSDLSPIPTTIPTVLSEYDYTATTYTARTPGGHGISLVTMKAKCDLRDATDVVIDSRTVQASWYTDRT